MSRHVNKAKKLIKTVLTTGALSNTVLVLVFSKCLPPDRDEVVLVSYL